ncbi:MAG: UbiA family prenyltransferase [Bacteroidetes bacterium]|nr:UbiA family prenyltransferase [Bacteroidota bacterium]
MKKYLSLVKFSHTIFAMPFALIGFFVGINDLSRIPHVKVFEPRNLSLAQKTKIFFMGNTWIFILVILCMVFARSAAMAFNRWLDKSFDAKNPRTAIREIPAGIIKSNNALWFVIINSALFIICTYFINSICFYLSPVALFVVLFYSYTKRFTALCHLVLGLGLSLAPIGAYLSVTGQFALLPVLFSFTVLFWVSGFDIIYALQDEEFDKENQLHSIPAILGKPKALMVSNILHIISAVCVVIAGYYGGFGYMYWAGVIFFIALLTYQHLLVKPNDLSKVDKAFFTTNGIASVVFAIFVILDLFIN